MVLVRVVKVDFSPSIQQHFSRSNDPLVVHIYGCTEKGKYVHLKLMDTEPRFWVQSEVDPIEVCGRDKHRIVKTTHGESTTLKGEPLWTIYCKHPADVYVLRKKFEETLQDKVFYTEAVRAYYGITAFINVSQEVLDEKIRFTPDLISSSKQIIRQARDFMFDIETGDSGDKGFASKDNPYQPVRCLTFQNMVNGKHYVAITKEVDIEKVKDWLSDSKWLKKHCNIREGWDGVIKPIPRDKIVVDCFDFTTIKDPALAEEEAERWIFKWFKDALNKLKPNRICGHNVVDFDVGYMTERSSRMNKEIKSWNKDNQGINLPRSDYSNLHYELWARPQIYDTMHGFTAMVEGSPEVRGRAALDWMCQKELGYGKINRKPRLIDDLYENDPEFLLAYNIWDCEAATRAVKVTDMLEFHASLCDYHSTGLDSLGSPKKMIMSMMRHRLKSEQIMPNLPKRNQGIEGGFVADAPKCLEESMFEIDLSKEYPSVIITMNMGFRTHVDDLRTIIDVEHNEPIPNVRKLEEIFGVHDWKAKKRVTIAPTSGNCYLYDEKSFVVEVLKEMAQERDEIRKKMFSAQKYSQEWKMLNNQQIARKISMNTWYGVIAQVYPEIGGDITDIARRHIKWIRAKVGEMWVLYDFNKKKGAVGFKEPKDRKGHMKLTFDAIYTDTDSAKCKIENRVEQEKKFDYKLGEDDILAIGKAISDKLNKSFGEFALIATGGATEEHAFDVKVEEAYKAYMQAGAKKRYAYLTYDDKVSTRGFDTRRSDSTDLTRHAMNMMFEMLLKDTENGIDEFLVWLQDFEDEIKTGVWDKACGKPIGLNSPNERTQHYKAAMRSNRCFKKEFKVGDKVWLWWIIPSNDVNTEDSNIIALEYGESPSAHNLAVDYDTIIWKFVRRKLDLILEPIFGKSIEQMLESKEVILDDTDSIVNLF